MEKVKGYLQLVGIDPRRVEFYNLSAAQGPRWAEICTEFTERIIKLGPSPLNDTSKQKETNTHNEIQAA